MEQQSIKKRVICENIYHELETYVILLNEVLGDGYFGKVMKAYNEANPYEMLAVKLIPFNGDKQRQAKIDHEINMIHELGQHPNLVKVLPIKCRSDQNYYIFMEYCDQGTLHQSIKEKLLNRDYFTEPQIFKTFYQVLSGYKKLLEKKVLHQDLKPQNILIKKGVHKISDFGFSIFYEGLKPSNMRQGTLEYMPLEKLTKVEYQANTKSDVYSLGVMFFKMITGRHPYILRHYEDTAEFIALLKMTELRPPAYLRARMSLPMQHLFEVVKKMVAKDETERIDFNDIYKYIEEEEQFLQFLPREYMSESQIMESEELHVPHQIENGNSHFVEASTAFAVPFSVMKTEEERFEQMIKIRHLELEEKKKFQAIINIENYLCSMRMIVYFYDRLSRRLTVQRQRRELNEMNFETIPPTLELDERVIIYLVFFSLKLTKQTLNESPKSSAYLSSHWTAAEWIAYKERKLNVWDLVKTDEKYLDMERNQMILSGAEQAKIQAIKEIIDESKLSLFEFMQCHVKPSLEKLFKERAQLINMDDKKSLVTMFYILTAIEIIENFEEKQEMWEELQNYFRETETKQAFELREEVRKGLGKYEISECFYQDWEDQA